MLNAREFDRSCSLRPETVAFVVPGTPWFHFPNLGGIFSHCLFMSLCRRIIIILLESESKHWRRF